MRTTVTLDDDTEQLVRARMERRGVSFKQALNDAIRDGAPSEDPQPYRMRTYSMGPSSVDLTHTLRVAADLEDAAIIERMRADG